MLATRTSWQVTRSVWHALFMREAIARTTADRMAWFWMLAEPVAMIGLMVLVRTVIFGSTRTIYGAGFIEWLVVGLFGFYLFRESLVRSLGVINAARALFTFRQVKSVDPVLIRVLFDGILRTTVFVIFILIGGLLELDAVADDPLLALWYWLSLWLLGAGFALFFSVAGHLVPEVARVIKLISLPLMLTSGVIIPLSYLPSEVQAVLLYNPVVHALELLRSGFFEAYTISPYISVSYLWTWVLLSFTAGLLMHMRFAQRLKAK